MTPYRTIYPEFWTGPTGKKIKAQGVECQLLAVYLMTCKHAHPTGLFYIPSCFMSHETGIGPVLIEGALVALCSKEIDFCEYDEASEWIWVKNMARFQLDPELKPGDKRIKWVEKALEQAIKAAPKLTEGFIVKYQESYNLSLSPVITSPIEGPKEPQEKPLRSPFEAPSKPENREQRTENREQRKEECSELLPDSDLPAAQDEEFLIFIKIPTNKKGESYPVEEKMVREWEELFPAVDVRQALRKMVAWSKANQKKRKTRGGMEKFIVNWLGGDQDKGRPVLREVPPINQDPEEKEIKFESEEDLDRFREEGRKRTEEILKGTSFGRKLLDQQGIKQEMNEYFRARAN